MWKEYKTATSEPKRSKSEEKSTRIIYKFINVKESQSRSNKCSYSMNDLWFKMFDYIIIHVTYIQPNEYCLVSDSFLFMDPRITLYTYVYRRLQIFITAIILPCRNSNLSLHKTVRHFCSLPVYLAFTLFIRYPNECISSCVYTCGAEAVFLEDDTFRSHPWRKPFPESGSRLKSLSLSLYNLKPENRIFENGFKKQQWQDFSSMTEFDGGKSTLII